MAITLPLDLQSILIDQFAGNFVIFIFISALFLSIMAGRFRMPNVVFGGMVVVFVVYMSTTNVLGAGSELTGILLIAAIVISFQIGKIFTRTTGG